jgi:hypothetical protein
MRSLALALLALPLLGASLSAQHEMPASGSTTVFRGFTDISWRSGGMNTGRQPAFGIGQFDLYITSAVSDRVSFSGETVFEFDDVKNEFVVDVERVVMTYKLDDHFRLLGGKVHTPIGYWNNAYHHGLALQPTIERPLLVHFEDDGGALPIHTVGVQLSGRDLTDAHLGFDMLLGNGLGNRPSFDTNKTPSVTVAMHSDITPSLRVGVSGYGDKVVAGTLNHRGDVLSADMTQTIGGGFLTYLTSGIEAIIEGQQVRNRSLGVTTMSPGWFAYAGYRVAPTIVPYFVHDQLKLASNDPYFLADDTRRETLGLRWEQSAAAVFKLEGRSIDRRGYERATDLAAQLAIAF